MINCYVIKVTGKRIDRFLKKVFKQKISIFSATYKKDQAILKVSYEDYLKIKAIKSVCEIKIIKTIGMKYYMALLEKYKMFLIFFTLGIVFILLLSRFIFFIEINHPKLEVQLLLKE